MAALDFPNSPSVNDQFSAAGYTWQWNGTVWNIISNAGGAWSAVPLQATFDGMGAVVLVNEMSYARARTAATILGYSIIAEGTSPTCTIDVLSIANGTVLPSASICGGNPPQLTTGNAVLTTSLSGWTTGLSAYDLLAFKVTACTGATFINIQLLII